MEIFYLQYIDDFTITMFTLVFILILMISFVFWTAKAFSWFINQVFELKKENITSYRNYDNV